MKRLTVLLLVLAIFASTATACAPHTAPSSPTESPTSTDTPKNEQQPILDAALEISEVMPDNRNLVMGHEWDWIELHNLGDTFGALNGFYLTDDLNRPEALSLHNYTIDAGEYLAVVLDDEAPFQLSEMGETIYLLRDGTVISELTFGSAISAASFNEEGCCKYPTPGFPNSEEGYLTYLDAQTLPDLVISEVLSDNSFYATDGMYYDYVELENRSDRPIDLSAYYLTNSWESTKRFYFPSVILEPGALYMIICSGNSGLGDNHAPFEIGSAEQTLYLAHQGRMIDTLTIPGDLKTNESYGRFGNIPVYMIEPTPGAKNVNGYFGGIAAPTASITPGQYEKAVTVELTGDGIIHYTLDGTRPTTESAVYSEPITVDGIATIRALCVVGERSSAVENFTYAVGVVHDLPILVISIPSANRSQLLTNINSSEEHESVMTLIENGEVKFSVPFGMRLHGNDSRKGAKKNFQLRFRGEYGAGKLKYQLFEDRDIDAYDSLLLKGGSEDYINAMVRDELATSIANGTSALYTQAMKPVVLYLGGDYWGIHFLRERFSAAYVASHLDVSEESVDLLFSSGGYAQTGSAADFSALKWYVQNHDMSLSENYAYLAEQIDINSLIDWYVFRTYLDDRDLANIRRFRSLESDGKWHWMFFDMDWGFYNQGGYPVGDIIEDFNGEPILINALLDSEEGRDAFLKRYAYLMETVLNEAYIHQCLDDLLAAIGSEMPRDRERWGFDYSSWEMHIQYIRDFSKDENRVPLILNDLQTCFQLTKAQMDHYFGNLR